MQDRLFLCFNVLSFFKKSKVSFKMNTKLRWILKKNYTRLWKCALFEFDYRPQ